MWFGAFSGYPWKFENLNKNIGFGGMWTLPGPLSEKLNFKFVINSKMDFSGGHKHKKLHFDTEFYIFGCLLGSLITSKHAFRWSWNFQKLMQDRYTSDLRTFEVAKIFPSLEGS